MVFLGALFSIAGICLSLASIYEHVSVLLGLNSHVALCNINQSVNCAAVINSPFSTFLGMPLGSYGLVFYASALALIRLSRRLPDLWDPILFLTAASVLLSIVLFLISVLYIDVVCPVCIAMYAVNLALFGLAVTAGRGRPFQVRFVSGARTVLTFPLRCAAGPGPQERQLRVWLLRLIFALAVAALLPVALRKYLAGRVTKSQAVEHWQAQPSADFMLPEDGALRVDYSKGDLNAPVRIVEFSDFQCPGCRRFAIGAERLLASYPGKISLTFRNFPLDRSCNRRIERELHEHACFAAEYARCAGEQGKFWEAAEYLFTAEIFRREGDQLAVREAIRTGDNLLGLDSQAVDECLGSGRQREKIKADIEDGLRNNVARTPAVFINGREVEEPSERAIRAIIDDILR